MRMWSTVKLQQSLRVQIALALPVDHYHFRTPWQAACQTPIMLPHTFATDALEESLR